MDEEEGRQIRQAGFKKFDPQFNHSFIHFDTGKQLQKCGWIFFFKEEADQSNLCGTLSLRDRRSSNSSNKYVNIYIYTIGHTQNHTTMHPLLSSRKKKIKQRNTTQHDDI